jgi:hypothetical protein
MRQTYLKSRTMLFRAMAVITVLVLAVTVVAPQVTDTKALALSGSEFKAGGIISDGIFFNGYDMNAERIQYFLSSKVPVCDTNGTQIRSGTTTRAQHGTANGYPPPYICLRDYVMAIPQKNAEDGLCTGIGAGTKTAAQIIYEVGISCGVNPKVLIVLLQKEQSLVTDDWPWSIQYRSATGYGCPDTAPCDAEYYGFFNQVYNAARQFKRYARDANSFTYQARANNVIRYNPNAACGAAIIYVQNQATAGLYNYTPYQPNAAALNNLYGTGDACSAYGNRNFCRIYTEWFGSTELASTCSDSEQLLPYVRRFYNRRTAQHFYSAYDCDVAFLQRLGFTNEGAIFNTTPAAMPWAVPVYRYYNPQTHLHVWSTQYVSQADLITGGTGYRQEAGIVFYVVRGDMPGVTPIVSFYNPNTYLHVFGPSPSQADIDFLYHKGGYLKEGITFFAQ